MKGVARILDPRIVTLLLLLGLLLPAWLHWSAHRRRYRLTQARDHIQAIFSARGAEAREFHAGKCRELIVPLTSGNDSISVTARLFLRGLTRLTESDAGSVELPAEEDLGHIATHDLVSSTRLFFHSGNFGKAARLLEVALARRDEHRKEVLRLAGVIYFELGRDEEVLAHCRELISLAPQDPRPHRVMAMVHRNHGRWEHFIDSAERAVKLSTALATDLVLELVDGYLHLGRTADARHHLDELLNQKPELIDNVPLVRARLLLQEGKHKECESILERFLARQPQHPHALLLLGKLQVSKGDFEDGIKSLNQAIEQAPADEEAHYQLGQAYARLGDQKAASRHLKLHRAILDQKVYLNRLESLASREPQNVAVRLELADTYSSLGLNDVAEFWQRAADAIRDP